MRKRIVIVTTGQPSTNPRMVKEYETLIRAGFDVRVVYAYWTDWAVKTDQVLWEKGGLNRHDFTLAGGSPYQDKRQYWLSRVVHKLSRSIAHYWQGGFAAFAIARPAFFLWWSLRKMEADLYIAHNLGALAPAVWAARKYKGACGFDLEDLYSGQFDPADPLHAMAVYLEKKYLPACDYLIAASPLIAEAYQSFVNKPIPVINNVFERSFLQQPVKKTNKGLHLFWFSQTVGENRGLETIVEAINLLPDCDICFHLIGDCSDEYRQKLGNLAVRKESVQFLPPVPADDLFGIAASYDIGMAAEVPHNENRDKCLTNKLFVYLTSGVCVLASDTQAQRLFMGQHPGIGYLYAYNNPHELAGYLDSLYRDRDYLYQCRQQAYSIAKAKYNWEMEEELLLKEVRVVLN
jgi:glycosyltransferase involved in cell wall biosynthesis